MISDLRLQQFRSYTDASFKFGEGVNIIVGPNGSGKTNLLEAILVLAHGSSYRVNDVELLQFDSDWLRLDAHIEPGDGLRTVKIQTVPRQTKIYEIDEKKYVRLTLQHTIPTVLFEPNHLQLLHGAPELLLKRSKQPSIPELFPWNLRLSELGATIARARAELCAQLAEQLTSIYTEISQAKTTVAIAYHPKFSLEHYESHLLSKLESHLPEDFARGFTTYGPHREDFVVTFDERRADESASRGETRTALLALKIIELQLLEKVRGETPILLLDDVFSELDGARRRALTGFLQRYQTFLTTTDADVVVKHFTDSTIIPLS
jgi:DNA replication and repair protein RecF